MKISSNKDSQELTKPTEDEIDDIVSSIDYDKIVADVVANQDQIVAEAVDKSKEEGKNRAKNQRNIAIFALIFGSIGAIGAIISLITTASLAIYYFLAAAIIGFLFAGFMYYLSRQSKKDYEEWKASQNK